MADTNYNKQIFFVVNTPLPNEQAHGIQIMQMADAFARQGCVVTLLIPHDGKSSAKDIFNFYKIPETFKICQIPTLRLPLGKATRLAFLTRWGSFSINVVRLLSKVSNAGDVIYVRGEMILSLSLFKPKEARICFETHIRPKRMGLYIRAMRRCELVITVTQMWAQELVHEFGISETKLIVQPDAVDVTKFSSYENRAELRQQLGLPLSKIIIVYAGSDRPWKGLEVFKDAAVKFGSQYLSVFVGNIQKKHKGDSRILYVGFQRHEKIPLWLGAADFLVLTGSLESPESERYTSPLKLFEYMAMKRPIIASDIPSFREVLDEKIAFLIPPNNVEAFIECVGQVKQEDALQRAELAYQKVYNYTWELRAQRILARL